MSAPIYRTKGELRSQLLIALGYGGLGASASAFVPRADYLLEQAQSNLYLLMPDEKRVREWNLTTGLNQRWYDIPQDCDIDRVLELSALFEQTWLPMARGIDTFHDSTFDYISYYPQRYDIRARDTNIELQTNGDMAIADTSVTGTTGFTWTSSNWEIQSGRAEHVGSGADTFTSDFSPLTATRYTLKYTIGVAAMQTISMGGVTSDINGVPLGLTVGSHIHEILTTNTNSLVFTSVASTAPTLDDVSIVQANTSNIRTQIELWPVDSDNNYPWKIEGYIKLAPFVDDNDRATIDDDLILLYAEAFGKAHLNKPDAGVVMAQLRERLRLLRGQQHGNQRYIRGEKTPDPMPRPIVIP